MGDQQVRLFGQISKIEERPEGLYLAGIASAEVPDKVGETVTANAMRKALASGYFTPSLTGEMSGPVREMHQLSAVGKTIAAEVLDDGTTHVETVIVDKAAIEKVRAGIYKGFSIGGRVPPGGRNLTNPKIIESLVLTELSLVDSPMCPAATFTMFKADGADAVEKRYGVRKAGEKWETYNLDTGKVYGTHDSEEQAAGQQRALYANAPPEEEAQKGDAPGHPFRGNQFVEVAGEHAAAAEQALSAAAADERDYEPEDSPKVKAFEERAARIRAARAAGGAKVRIRADDAEAAAQRLDVEWSHERDYSDDPDTDTPRMKKIRAHTQALRARKADEPDFTRGDRPGHPFRGNQHTEGAYSGGEADREKYDNAERARTPVEHRSAARHHSAVARIFRDAGDDQIADAHEHAAKLHQVAMGGDAATRARSGQNARYASGSAHENQFLAYGPAGLPKARTDKADEPEITKSEEAAMDPKDQQDPKNTAAPQQDASGGGTGDEPDGDEGKHQDPAAASDDGDAGSQAAGARATDPAGAGSAATATDGNPAGAAGAATEGGEQVQKEKCPTCGGALKASCAKCSGASAAAVKAAQVELRAAVAKAEAAKDTEVKRARAEAAEKLAKAEADLAGARAEVARLKGGVDEKTAKAAAAEGEVVRLRASVKDLDAALTKVSGERNEARAEATIASGKLEKATSASAAADKEIARLRAVIAGLEAQIRKAAIDHAEVKGIADRTGASLQKVSAARDGAEAEVKTLTAERDDLTEKVAALETALAKATAAAESAENDVARLRAQVDETEKALATVRAEREETHGGLTKASSERDLLSDRVTRLQAERETMEMDVSKIRRERDEAEARATKLQAEIDVLEDRLGKVQVERDTAEQKAARERSTRLDLDSQVTKVGAEATALQTRLQKVTAEVDDLRRTVAVARREKEAAQAHAAKLDGARKAAESQLQKVDAERRALEQEMRSRPKGSLRAVEIEKADDNGTRERKPDENEKSTTDLIKAAHGRPIAITGGGPKR